VIAFAERLAVIGTPNDAEAQTAFTLLQRLIFSRERLAWTEGSSLRKSVDALPTGRVELMRVVAAGQAAEKIEPLGTAKFSLSSFIEASQMLRTDTVGPYVELVLSEETHTQKTIRGILNSASIAYWSGKRAACVGVFPQYGNDGDLFSYQEQVRKKVKTIS
jgi:hypothetical protein